MRIDSQGPSRIHSSEETETPETREVRATSHRVPLPDYGRLPSNDAATVAFAAGSKDVRPKIDRVIADLQELRSAFQPFLTDMKHGMDAAFEIKEAVELLLEATHRPWLSPIAVPVALKTLEHAIPAYWHALEGMHGKAPETVARAKAALEALRRDVADLVSSTVTPLPIERPVHTRV